MTGGAGYIGCVLTERLLERGYDVRVLDRLYWGEQPLAALRDRIELVVADVREIPASAFDGVDGVITSPACRTTRRPSTTPRPTGR